MKAEQTLPMKDLEIFGIYKNGQFTIPEKEVNALKNGRMTDIIELKNLKGKDVEIEKLPARLSIVRGADGNPSLRIDPVYREPNVHPRLDDSEKRSLMQEEVANIKKSYVDKEGNIQTEVIEYDKSTKQFMSFDPRAIKAPEKINNETLTPQQKRKFKEGEMVQLADGTEFQISTSSSKGIRSNKNALVLSILVDGGISYLLISGIKRMLGKKSAEDKSYSKGYLDAIKEVQKQVERRIALNPKDKDAVNDLSNVKEEYSKISADTSLPQSTKQDFDISKIKKLNSVDTEEGRKPSIEENEDKNESFRRGI
jgi:hypothetical protein